MDIKKIDFIQYLCEKKLKELSLHENDKYIQALERELTNVNVQNLQDYIISLIKNKVKVKTHGSLMYYLLNISSTDPIKNNIVLKIKKQSSFPDIDSDFSMNERELVIKYFIDKYGNDHVAPIGSYGQMKMKMVLRDIARIFDIDIQDTNDVVKNLADDVDEMSEEVFDATLMIESGQDGFRQDLYDIKQYLGRHPQIREILFKLKGQLRHLTKHPAGVVATPTKIDETIPLMRHKNELITSWVDGIIRKDLQSSGFIKFDILGLKTLSIIKEILDIIRSTKSYNDKADFDLRSIEHKQITSLFYEEFSSKLPLDGNNTIYSKFRQTDTNGIFQFECIDGNSWVGSYRIKNLYDMFEKNKKSIHKVSCVNLNPSTRKMKIRQKIFAMKKQVRDVYRVTVQYDNDRCIETALLHEFYTPRGWKRLEELKVDDKILIDQERFRCQHYCAFYNRSVDVQGIAENCASCIRSGQRTCRPQLLSKFRPIKTYKKDYILRRVWKKGKVKVKIYKRFARHMFRYIYVPIKAIQFVGTKEVYDIGFDPEAINHNYIANGFVVHNSNLMKALLKEIKPTTFSDITTATALGRPGPLDMGMHHEYAQRKNGKEFNYESKLVEKCLKSSYGILVYQEDVMRLCHMVAGFPLDLTDTVRKNLMKSIRDTDAKDKEAKQRKEIHDKFIKGCISVGDLIETSAEILWQSCVAFARYGFNRSHAVAYTVLSYQMMWFKEYYALEFYVVLLSNSLKEKFTSYFAEIISHGISIVPANISRAKEGFSIYGEEKSIMFGLGHINHVGPAVINNILQSQPFDSFEDFCEKTSQIKKITKTAMIALISGHAFDAFGTQNEILEKYYKEIRKEKKWERDVDYNDTKYEHEQFIDAYALDWRTKLSDSQKREVAKLKAVMLTNFTQPKVNMKATVWGVASEIVEKTSKANNSYYYVTLTDSKFNMVKVRIPCYNRRCSSAFLLKQETGKYAKVKVQEVIKVDNILVGEAVASEYMGRIFIDLLDICCVGNLYERTPEQKEKLAKYDEMANE
jgi:DNA polymerase III alpha subunit